MSIKRWSTVIWGKNVLTFESVLDGTLMRIFQEEKTNHLPSHQNKQTNKQKTSGEDITREKAMPLESPASPGSLALPRSPKQNWSPPSNIWPIASPSQTWPTAYFVGRSPQPSSIKLPSTPQLSSFLWSPWERCPFFITSVSLFASLQQPRVWKGCLCWLLVRPSVWRTHLCSPDGRPPPRLHWTCSGIVSSGLCHPKSNGHCHSFCLTLSSSWHIWESTPLFLPAFELRPLVYLLFSGSFSGSGLACPPLRALFRALSSVLWL